MSSPARFQAVAATTAGLRLVGEPSEELRGGYLPFSAYPDVLSTAQAAEALGTNGNTLRKLIHDGALRAVRLGRVYRVPKSALIEFIGEGA